jgi:hypothetical protein
MAGYFAAQRIMVVVEQVAAAAHEGAPAFVPDDL